MGFHDRELQIKTNSTLNKLRKITLSGVLGKILRAQTNGLRLRESMDQGMINLLDLSELTSDEKKLIGSICLTFAELAGKSRADTPALERDKLPYHFVMVDEAPTLMEHSVDAIESFASELRKYKVSIVLGMQGIKDQLPREVASAIFRNFGTLISFRLGEPDDAQYVHRSMNSEVIYESDYLQIEPYHAYMRMQVGNERTRPFLVRMKPPGPALYRDLIADIKDRTISEAMEIEEKILAQINDKKSLVEEQYEDDDNDKFEKVKEITKEQIENLIIDPVDEIESNKESKQLQHESHHENKESLVGQINVRKEVQKDDKMDKKEASLEDALF